MYGSGLACQFIVIDGLPDGDYTLQSTTNAQHRVGEDCFGDNTIWTGLRITGNAVQEIDPPFIPEDRIPFVRANVAAIQVGGRWKVAEGSHWMLDTGTSEWEARRAVDLINHYRLASLCFVGRPRCGDLSPMTYWLTDTGGAPTGTVPGEDCLPFDPSNLAVVEVGGRWKVVEGTHWLLDFGPGQGNAVAALHFIRKHRFDQICFVGRPDPSMTYFKANGPHRHTVGLVDPRRIEAAIDHPHWWREQAAAIAEAAPAADLGSECAGTGDNPRRLGAFTFEVRDAEATRIVERHGITGLAIERLVQVRLARPAAVVDVGLAHFGVPPKVIGYAGEEEVARLTVDPRQRQIENARLVGGRIDRLLITSPDADTVLNYVRYEALRRGDRGEPDVDEVGE